MQYLPIFTQVSNRKILVVGGGNVALRKARTLVNANAKVTLLAPEFCNETTDFIAQHQLTKVIDVFSPEHLSGYVLVIAATDNEAVNQAVYDAANARDMFVNVVDDTKRSTFIFPSIVDRDPITIAISSAGKAPVLARRLREKLETFIPQHIGALATLVGGFRDQVKNKINGFAARRQFWERVFNSQVVSKVAKGQIEAAQHDLKNMLDAPESDDKGEVYIVGGGPGNPDLLTLRALQLMQQADVVVYDRLISPKVLDLVRRDAELISVGKKAGFHSVPQEQINTMLVELAQQGHKVCRLKGGDPFIFGRGGEEIEELVQHNIPFQVVPGITAAAGCAAYAGIPLTHRDYAQSVEFVTGHCQPNGMPVNWQAMARENHTLVIYMGVMKSPEIADALLTHGRDANTPVAIIEKGSTSQQRVVTGTLAQLPSMAADNHIGSPALVIVGEVVSLRNTCQWFEAAGAQTGQGMAEDLTA
ncbi:siroheme synthase CysG [Flocculibacter collagenilyticus]|uniref:siroheme synthase CysG n=1 Tax=Flocculibacter collagenilyticus TaxID=2744479 RepID=UPI0018F2C121|nr:siroheme synthase CysG [Flocculibacter collagenilyticus]